MVVLIVVVQTFTTTVTPDTNFSVSVSSSFPSLVVLTEAVCFLRSLEIVYGLF
jgi:hypothetical protein